ncbi:PIN domain-containing protein [Frankia sp. CiP3]|uniref:PIN domain-containing protein n=1 Tax=Frankia sp. CiP3 TaxID=2880971 RepID=UPI001EF69B0E|nr:PIN domain-containing protein [Frankia sp. CiP3]
MIRANVRVKQAIDTIARLSLECGNVRSALSGTPQGHGWRKYLDWADTCERQLRDVFADPAVLAGLHTERYWRIVSDVAHARQAMLINAEIDLQVRRLDGLAERLRGYLQLRSRPGAVAVVDTNVLLHHQHLDKILWGEVVGERPVRLVIPLLVLDELDDKRYSDSAAIRRKARSAVEPLDRLQPELERDAFAALPDGTTVEYLLDDPGHRRQANPDDELLDRAQFLRQVIDLPVAVVTGDRGVRVRATARGAGLRAVVMPDKFARNRDAPLDGAPDPSALPPAQEPTS